MTGTFSFLLSSLPVLASAAGGAVEADSHGEGGGGGHSVSFEAQPLFPETSVWSFVTNSIFVAILVTLLILWFCRSAMKRRQQVPGGRQNFVELVVDFLYKQVENIVGPSVAPRAFPLLATIFLFVTISNWFGLLPGVGTIGLSSHLGPFHSAEHIETPLLRPATADMNMTIGIAVFAGVIWLYLTLREIGFVGFLKHTFAPKGGLEGVLKFALAPIFLIVGVIEIVSMLFRPVTLSLRLYGNIFAGENLLHTMSNLIQTDNPYVTFLGSVILPIPFYFLEILVGVLQGMVFALLTAVFIKLSTTHDEEHGDHAHH